MKKESKKHQEKDKQERKRALGDQILTRTERKGGG